MQRRATVLVVAGALALLLLTWTAASDAVPLWHEPPPGEPAAVEQPTPPPMSAAPVDTLPPDDEPSDGPDLTWFFVAVAVIAAVFLLVVIIRFLLSIEIRRPRRRRGPVEEPDPLPALAEALEAAAEDLGAALRRGSPRNAIVECWVRLEAAVAEAGVTPRPSETSTELTTRVLTSRLTERPAGEPAIAALGALYREARFSRHELGEPERERAIRALERVRDELTQQREQPMADQGAS